MLRPLLAVVACAVAAPLVALDRARVFQLGRAKSLIIDELTDSVVKDPIDTEVVATERVIKNYLPESLIFEEEDGS